jgi:hypothetical protein
MTRILFALVILCALPAAASVSFSGTFYDTADVPNGVVSADLNRDGLPDVVSAGGSMVSVFLATSPGSFGAKTDYTVSGPSDLKDVLAADFNGDGALDLIVSHLSVHRLSILWNNGDGTFRSGPTLTLGAIPTAFDLGDFNHDGLLDVATLECNFSYPLSCSVNVYPGKGKGVFTKLQTIHLKSAPANHLSVADMNGDSNPDVVISRGSQVVLFWGQGDGTVAAPSYLTPKDNDDVESFAIGDFNNDGRLDVVIDTGTRLSTFMGCLSGNSWSYQNRGAKSFSLVSSSPGGCSFLDRIDMNGDLTQDLFFQNGDPDAGFFAGLLGNGDGSFRAPQSQSFPNQGGGPLNVRDLNLDSRDDYIMGFGGFLNETVVGLQTGGAKNCKPPSSAKLAAKICVPASGATLTSPVLVRAAGNSPAGVIQLQVWIDDVKKSVKWHDQFAKKFSLSPGTHRIGVVATDRYFGTAKTSVNVTVP